MNLTTEQKRSLYANNDFKKDLQFAATVVAQYIISEPNYGLDYSDPADIAGGGAAAWTYTQTQIQNRIRSYWQKRYQFSNTVINSPEDEQLYKKIFYSFVSGSTGAETPITLNVDVLEWTVLALGEHLKNHCWNNLAGVRSNEYPWAGENGTILEPSDPNWYSAHFGTFANRLV